MRFTVIAAAMLLSTPAHAIKCDQVRALVAKYGQANVERYARSSGYTEAQIVWTRRNCVKPKG